MRLMVMAICAAAIAGCVEDVDSPLAVLPQPTNEELLAYYQNGCRTLGLESGSVQWNKCLAIVKELEAARAAFYSDGIFEREWIFKDDLWDLVKAQLIFEGPHQK